MAERRIYRQPPIKGGRHNVGAGLIRDIEIAVNRIARQYSVSRSWVVATILADALGIEEQVPYYMRRGLKNGRQATLDTDARRPREDAAGDAKPPRK